MSNEPLLQKKKLEQAKEPEMFTVIIHNDDFTPTDFVTSLLMNVFGLGVNAAEIITFNIHSADKAQVGSFTREIAESKSAIVNNTSRGHEHPLLSEIQEL